MAVGGQRLSRSLDLVQVGGAVASPGRRGATSGTSCFVQEETPSGSSFFRDPPHRVIKNVEPLLDVRLFCESHQRVPRRASNCIPIQTRRRQCFEEERSKITREKDLTCVDTKMHAVEPLALALYIAHNDNVRVKVCQRCVRESRKKSRFTFVSLNCTDVGHLILRIHAVMEPFLVASFMDCLLPILLCTIVSSLGPKLFHQFTLNCVPMCSSICTPPFLITVS